MNAIQALQGDELTLLIVLSGLIALEIVRSIRGKSWVSIYRPTLFVGIILAYYAIAGPLRDLGSQGAIYRGLDHREVLIWGWFGAVLSFGSILFGFYAFSRHRMPCRLIADLDSEGIYRLGLRLCQVGLVMFGFVSGARLFSYLNPVGNVNPFGGLSVVEGVDVGSFANYFHYSINLLIPGICLMYSAWLRERRHSFVLGFWLLAAFGIYTSLGFRYRLVLLAIPLVLLSFMAFRRRPSLVVMAMFLAVFIAINGLIGLTRSYGGGLDIARIEGQGFGEFFDAGFGESAVFYTTSGVIEQTPDRYPYVGPAPLVATLLFPVPRRFFPAKPDASYVNNATSILYGGDVYAIGSVLLNYGEYYLIAGWPSLIAFSMLLGALMRRLWNWFLVRQNEPFAQVVYLLTASYLYVVISRGYLPQVVMLFAFSVAPLFWLYGRWAKPVE